ncbi:DUF1223 domain-containing protein [Methylocapsa polymorpha]|uniref:DUF1223 domain-containing protein n=1 Tax=Methylocapsa polymorpha TaxID=3080828 RepID=A0ABZ0HMY3_9HYPH|nr:DUF1223 domain-containing protein [Methylocapsa sp. RX1]
MILFNRTIFLLCAQAASAVMACCSLAADPPGSAAASYVVELFTSQGCSSCPPADRLLASIARKPDVVAVSFPVDYWDYIGWKDTLALPAFSARQRAYAAARDGHVYTPQAIVDGLAGAVGSDRDEIEQAIKSVNGRDGAMTLPMRLSNADGRLQIEVAEGGGGPAGVFVLRVLRTRTVRIGRGENAGRSVTYVNVVRAIDKLGDWTGATATFDVPETRGEDEGYVVLVQRGTLEQPGAILGAAKTAGL